MAFRLSIEDGSYVQTLEVRSGSLTVGRAPPNGLALSSPGLSARHAVFRQVGAGVEVEALPTKIGVRMRGERIDRAVLAVGDSVQLGWAKVSLVEVADADVATAAAPPAPPPEPEPPTPPLPKLEFADEPPPPVAASPVASAAAAVAAPPRPAVHAPAAEPAADFVVLSRKAIRVLPWWGISVALHALAFGALLLVPAAIAEREEADATISVTIRRAPARVDLDETPVVEPTRRGVDVARPDMDVPAATPDSTLPPSSNPKGQGGTGPTRTDEPELVVGDGGSPWAQTGGSTSVGIGAGGRIGAGVASNLDETFGKDGAGRANAAAAGRLNGDPFTRSLVNGLKLRTNEKNVKVVKGDYDQGELVMDALGLRHGFITGPEMAKDEIDPEVRAIFYNCTGRAPSRDALASLTRWVEAGGWLFSSDWGVELVVDKAFPGYIRPLKDGARMVMTPDETISFTIAPGKHLLLAGLPPEAETARWWLEDSSIPFTIEKPEAVEVLVQSAELDRKYKSKLVAVTFPHGKGRVVHVLGHMYQKEGNLRGAYAMQRLLLNFLHQAIKRS